MRNGLIAAASALAMYATPGVAQEQVPGSGFYIAPVVHAVRTDDDRAVDDGAAFTLGIGAEMNREWNLELNLFRGRFDGAGGDDLTMDAAGVDALRVFRRSARIEPYLLAGLGAQRKDRRLSETSTDLYADAGMGLLATFLRSKDDGRAVSVRFDARARYDDMDEGSRIDYLLGVGLQYAFGSGPRRAPAPALIPAAAPVPPSPPPDADNDGVPDDADRCPGTPPGQAVGADGCELDSDADKVVESADTCPGTPRGTRVDARGCELTKEIRLPQVTFEYDSDRLKPEASETLDQAVRTLRMNPDLRAEVAGYTDSNGSDAYNLSLSQRRAEAVRRYLIDHGVANVLTARGYGEADPVADNRTDAGRAENRRVVLRIISP